MIPLDIQEFIQTLFLGLFFLALKSNAGDSLSVPLQDNGFHSKPKENSLVPGNQNDGHCKAPVQGAKDQ